MGVRTSGWAGGDDVVELDGDDVGIVLQRADYRINRECVRTIATHIE